MTRRHFTVAEVEALIPSLERIFVRVIQLRAGMRATKQKLDRAGIHVDSEESFETDSDPIGVRRAKAVLCGVKELLDEELANLRALGGEVKDLDSGTVDFPGRRLGEDVLLCWKIGEQRIGFWHTREGGFAGRRPIDDQFAGETSRVD